MRRYIIIDFKDIVTRWYNDFLPEAFESNLMFLEKVDLVYLNSLPLESRHKESVKFILDSANEMLNASGADIGIVVQEPKPVNAISVQKFLRFVDEYKGFSEDARNNLLHIANKRYVVSSSSILVSDDKTIGAFLDGMFSELKNTNALRFYSSQSIGVKDVEDAASRLFPKNLLIKSQGNLIGRHIQVNSSTEVLTRISNEIMKDSAIDSRTQKFIEKCQKMVMKDFEQII